MFKKILSVILINVLVFYQTLFYIPLAYAQEATESAVLDSTTEESSNEPASSPSPTPSSTENQESQPEADPLLEEIPSASVEPSSSPEPSPEATATPTPSPTPSLDLINETESFGSATLSEKSTIRPIPSEKKIKKDSSKNYVEGQVLVKFRENKINLKQPSNITKAEQFAASRNLELEDTIEKSNVAVLETKGGESVESAVSRLRTDPNVQDAQPNFIYKPLAIATNDTHKDKLWGLDNTGQTVNGVTGTSDSDIDAPEAWVISEGNSSVVVAVIDDGVAYNHPDLQNAMWDGTSCKDENGSALNDCNHGYDFEDNDKTPLPTTSSHGTHIAGTIAAVKNNSAGIIGVAPQVKVMALRVGSESFSVDAIVKAIDFAIQNGAKVINASFGGNSNDPLLKAAIDSFDGLFIAAAGNNASNNDTVAFYPCNFDSSNIVCVAATDQDDNLADFIGVFASNYGATSVDVAAPGKNIYSTIADIISSQVFNEDFTSATLGTTGTNFTSGGTNNDWGVWNASGNKVISPTLTVFLPYAGNSDSTLTFNSSIDTSTSTAISMELLISCNTEVSVGWTDYVQLELLNNNNQWVGDSAWRFNEVTSPFEFWNLHNITVSDASFLHSGFKFRFRWITNDVDNNYFGCDMDDIAITKHTLGSNELYEYFQGTSMAVPHVSGVAALVWSYNSARTYSQVKSIILNTGDAKTSLSGKTVTGKRVNAHQALLATNGPTITGLADDANPTKLKTWEWNSADSSDQYRFAIDTSATWTPTGEYGSTKTATQPNGNGTYYLHVQARNSSGIESDVVTFSAVLDNTAPSSPGTPSSSPSSPTNQTSQTWTWEESIDNIVGTITYFWSIINAVTNNLFATGNTTSTSLVTNLLEGVWNFIVQAQDSAGNQSATSSGSLTVDTTAPDAPIVTSPSGAVFVNDNNFSIAGTAEAGSLVQVKSGSTVVGSQQLGSSETAFSISVPLTQDSANNFTITATDTAGNESTQATVPTITEDSTNPSITTYTLDNTRISPQASIGTKDTATIDLAFSEAVEADFEILNSTGTKVRDLYNSSGTVTNPDPKVWDGKDNSGAFVAEGAYTIKIVITDRAGNSITDTTKTITVDNDLLTLNPIGNKSVDEESELTFTAQGDDEEGGTLTYSLTNAPTGASINSSTGVFTWTPTELQGPGSYEFTVNVTSTTEDEFGVPLTKSDTFTVTVNEVNQAPVADSSSASTDEDTAKIITLSASDSDFPANTLTYAIVTGPSHGTLSTISENQVTYTPDSNYNGADSFTFKVNDGTVDSNTATVSITVEAVNDAPVCSNVDLTTDEDTQGSVNPNCVDVDGDSLTYLIVVQPEHGTASVGSLIYNPESDFNGTDQFTYKASDGLLDSNVADVNVTVNAVNDAPVAEDDAFTTDEDTALEITADDLLDNDTDVDGDTLSVAAVGNPVNGSVVLLEDSDIIFTPSANYNTEDAGEDASFEYTISDGNGGTDTTTVFVTVEAVNDAPVAVDDTVSITKNTLISIDVLANDTDVENDDLFIISVSDPASGAVNFSESEITFEPEEDFIGVVSFEYTVSDGDLTDTGTVIVNVTPEAEAPEISGETSNTTGTDSIVVSWTTNVPTSGRVIYDTVSHPVLGAAPNYDYAFSTGEFDTSPKTTSHTITITGLSDGTTYYFRTVSAGSPIAISNEFGGRTFTTTGAPAPGPAPAPTVLAAVTPLPAPFAAVLEVFAEEERVLGEEEEIAPTPTPTPTPTVAPTLGAEEEQPTLFGLARNVSIGLIVLILLLLGFFGYRFIRK